MDFSTMLFLGAVFAFAAWWCGSAGLFQILGYEQTNTGALIDIPAITTNENNFSARNGHWIFTEQYDLCAAFVAGAAVTQAQFFDATYNAVNIPQIYPANLGITPLTNPNILDLRAQPFPLPMNEEFALQINDTNANVDYGLIWICPSGSAPWNTAPPVPTLGAPTIYALVTSTVVLTTKVWSPAVTVNFSNTLKGGVYQVNGAYWIVANALAYKHIFPKTPLYNGRKLTPGSLVENAYGNVPIDKGRRWMGVQGWFNYFEPFQVSILGSTTTGSTTYTGILDMTYMGNNFPAGTVPGT